MSTVIPALPFTGTQLRNTLVSLSEGGVSVIPTGGSTTRTLADKLGESVSVLDFMSAALATKITGRTATSADAAGTSAAIAAALSTLVSSGRRGALFFPGGAYFIDETIAVTGFGVRLVGSGPLGTTITATHTDGPVIRLQNSHQGVQNMKVDAVTDRTNAAAGQNHGIVIEPVDTPNNPGYPLALFPLIENVIVEDQPGSGIVFVATVNGGQVTRCDVKRCGEHGIVIDNGTYTSRTNKLASGLVTIGECTIFDCGGHGLLSGAESENTNRVFRVVVRNTEMGRCASDAAVRKSNYLAHLFGTHFLVLGCAFAGINAAQDEAVTGGLLIAGRGHQVLANRFLSVLSAAIRVENYTEWTTQGVNIDGISMSAVATGTQASLDPAVSIAADARGVSVRSEETTFITALTERSRASIIAPMQIVRKVAAQSVAESTTLINDDALKLPLRAKERLHFEVVLFYAGDPAGDLKLGFTIPSGASIWWATSSGLRVSPTDTIVVQGVVTSTAATMGFGCASGSEQRAIHLVGNVVTDGTAGDLQLQWAQVTSNATATQVFGTSFIRAVRQ